MNDAALQFPEPTTDQAVEPVRKPSRVRGASELAREHTQRAISIIAEVMDTSPEAKERLRAAEMLLDRGHGKPMSTTIQIPAQQMAQEALAQMSDDELLTLVRGAPLPRLRAQAASTVDATVIDVESVPSPEPAASAAADPILA